MSVRKFRLSAAFVPWSLSAGLLVSIASALLWPMPRVAAMESAERRDVRYDPLERMRLRDRKIDNIEAVIPPQCYTKTAGVSNPCWTCHTDANGQNFMADADLQEAYAFSEAGKTNHWSNLFGSDRRHELVDAISDREILDYIRQDNYSPLREALAERSKYLGWRPDVDLAQGFDAEGFAVDGTQWRAFRFKPFPGTFWPTNGSTDDILIRLPRRFRQTASGTDSREIYKINLAILELAMTQDERIGNAAVQRTVEPLNEVVAGLDLDGDGTLETRVTRLHGLPAAYVGAADDVEVRRYQYPLGTEFVHTVRYVDPDEGSLLSARLKELRYASKRYEIDEAITRIRYEAEQREKEVGAPPRFGGNAQTGLINSFGWLLQGYIEDSDGLLRLQTREEHMYCMGCHSTLGVTVDQTFGFPRKVPGADGWAHQNLAGIQDVPQVRLPHGEYRTYFERVRGGDEFRANDELLTRFFSGGDLDMARLRAAGREGHGDIRDLIVPSRQRALELNKAYRALVLLQDFELGRDFALGDIQNVHRRIENEETDLNRTGRVYRDGRLWLNWCGSPGFCPDSKEIAVNP